MDDKGGAKVRLPFVIGTEEFKADKAIGLNVAPIDDEEENKEKKQDDDEEDEDSDVEEFVKGIKVGEKQKEKWEKIRKKKRRIK